MTTRPRRQTRCGLFRSRNSPAKWPRGSAREGLFGLGLATAVCVALELVRELRYDTDAYRFLVWNLVLAWIPLVLALHIYFRSARGGSLLELAPATVLWLLFLPNAPYIATDFIHLESAVGVPLWFDGVILAAFACTGMVVGFVSLYFFHGVVRERHGPRAGWWSVMVVIGFASAGIFIGRFMRWNSWDVLVRPGERLAELVPRLADPSAVARAAGLTLALTLLLAAAYTCFYLLLRLRVETDGAFSDRRAPRRL